MEGHSVISPEVLARYAADAAAEVQGVRTKQRRGAHVTGSEVEVHVVIDSGASLPEDGRPTLEPGRLALGPGGRLLVGAADRPLELLEVQPEGRRAMSGAEFARGARLGSDEWLGR